MAFLQRGLELILGIPCANAPENIEERQIGKCHICEQEASVGFCPVCCHWFCRECSGAALKRIWGALMEQAVGRKQDCCGPSVS